MQLDMLRITPIFLQLTGIIKGLYGIIIKPAVLQKEGRHMGQQIVLMQGLQYMMWRTQSRMIQ